MPEERYKIVELTGIIAHILGTADSEVFTENSSPSISDLLKTEKEGFFSNNEKSI